jgi:BirA family transcriptional regulator, biotin operon repressor / biotin---[acetyl-CoA-carboxylase] ligase
MNNAGPPLFLRHKFEQALRTAAVGRRLLYRDTVDTTMLLARSEADAGAPHGTLVLAEEQTAGRGRHGRTFYSPPAENLYFTLILRTPLEMHRRLPVATPLAVVLAIQAEGVEARIKWPNDIWVEGRKLCGMLIDAEISAEGGLAFVGIGINVNGDPSLNPELRDTATSVAGELGHAVSREVILAHVCNELERALDLEKAGLAEAYRAASMVLGRRITVHPVAGEPYEALAAGIEDDGGLRIQRDDGREETLLAAEVSIRPSS